ncbi:MAG: hypothetical protein FWG45_07920 [Oscillospiraceae bacterium]|nr:hypothetical protein [Oscillospiraceae bacterium]
MKENKVIKRKRELKQTLRVLSVCTVVATTIIMLTLGVSAAGENYVKGVGELIFDNVAWVILIVGLCGAGFAAVKRNYTAALITVGVTAVLFVVFDNAETIITTVGDVIKDAMGI